MKAKIIKLGRFSGKKASVYAIWYEELKKTSLDIFIIENKNVFLSELNDITLRLKAIGNKTGAREQFFKINEGSSGDGVCALYDDPDKKLRLYCIRYGSSLVIVGGGGQKNVQRLQQDEVLKRENYLLRKLSAQINERCRDGDIWFTGNGQDLEGDLEFNI